VLEIYFNPNNRWKNYYKPGVGRRLAGHEHVWGRGELYEEFWWGNVMERDRLEGPDVYGRIILKWNFRNLDGAWTGLTWLRIETGDRLLLMW
jgi:hypothetical protein